MRTAVAVIGRLSEYLYKYDGRKVIILLDEYDTPLQEADVNGYWNELAAFIRKFFNSAFNSGSWLERAVMKGITRVCRESVFSDLNNLEVVSVTSDKYKTVFGFTEEEVFLSLEEYGLTDQKEEVKKWYDGFIFGNTGNIYNPRSITNFPDKRVCSRYWSNTGSNALVSRLIREGGRQIKLDSEVLLKGAALEKAIDEQIVFSRTDIDEDAVYSLLLAGGI